MNGATQRAFTSPLQRGFLPVDTGFSPWSGRAVAASPTLEQVLARVGFRSFVPRAEPRGRSPGLAGYFAFSNSRLPPCWAIPAVMRATGYRDAVVVEVAAGSPSICSATTLAI